AFFMALNQLEKGYEPHEVEKKWYDFWEENELFAAPENTDNPAYSIVIPPPNVTGVLHMGHALNVTLQDILCRYRRLKGDAVLWMPGTDHAGIATQNVVEKKLATEGVSRHQLGREKFIEAVWAWRKESGSAIINQLKRLGASCDWKRERFTMDEGLSDAVRKVFVQLYHDGLIYQGDYIINWCHRCFTALSDLEVEHEDVDSFLYHIRYPFPDRSDGLVIATTRPETLFGDTAVAIHPDDPRYQDLPSHEVMLPLTNRRIPIIRDTYVGMEFGTGALKVTPAHDPNDFEIGGRHDLARLKVIDDNGQMNDGAGRFSGMDRFACRQAAVDELRQIGLLEKMEPYRHSVGHCYRCKTIVEPNLSKQWFVSARPLAEKAIAAVQNGKTRIVPETWVKNYFDWLTNIRDWCISRQIWWGHQIPAWTCSDCNHLTVSIETPIICPHCGQSNLVQETDVLDTWFSSALWPFSTMGWPNDTPLLRKYYPTSVLVTGFDILFFWVARMMMMGIHFMNEVPFKDVYVPALVRDESGKKMSKSKGNVIDPLTVIDRYGTDAFRMTLAAFAAQGRDIKMSEKRVEGYRHFINKLWNAARFALMHVDQGYSCLPNQSLSLPNRWILSRSQAVVRNVMDALDNYHFNEATSQLYQFVWHEFCDWYLEAVKSDLYEKEGEQARNDTRCVMWHVLRDILILLHPMIPFVTEEIWHMMPGTSGSIMRAEFPGSQENRIDLEAERHMSILIEITTAIRNIRGEMNLAPSLVLKCQIQTLDERIQTVVQEYGSRIQNLARLESVMTCSPGEKPRTSATAIIENAVMYVPLEGVLNVEQEVQRLDKELKKINTDLDAVIRKLNNEDFLSKAPVDVIEKVKSKQSALVEKQTKLQMNIEKIRSIQKSEVDPA
ncbi:MAG: valine--tRNA ligase, partial [Desulfatirhabdiaceae bacterium]